VTLDAGDDGRRAPRHSRGCELEQDRLGGILRLVVEQPLGPLHVRQLVAAVCDARLIAAPRVELLDHPVERLRQSSPGRELEGLF
jgi:hypothetical protein